MSHEQLEKSSAVSKQNEHGKKFVEDVRKKEKPDYSASNVTEGAHLAVMQESFSGQLQTNVAVQDDVYSMGQIRASFETHRNPVPGFPQYGRNEEGPGRDSSGLSLSQVPAFPSLGTSSSNTAYREILQSSLENSLDQNQDEHILSVRVEKIVSDMNDSNFSKKLLRIAKEIAEREKKFKVTMEAKDKHETQLKIEKLECERKLKELREENVKLINKIKTMERSESGIAVAISRESMDEWVKVEKNNQSAQRKECPDREIDQKIREQEIYIKKLSDANRKWDEQWKLLQAQFNTRIVSLQENVEHEKENNKSLNKNQETLQKDIQALKNALQDAETSKNASEADLTQKIQEKDALISVLQQKLNDATPVGRMFSSASSPLPQMQTTQPNIYQDVKLPPNYGVFPDFTNDEMVKTLREENSALKHQVAVFEEDFRRERTDRAKAQAEKDEVKTEYAHLKENYRQLEKKHRDISSELKTAKDNIGQLMVENERVKLANNELRTKSLHQMRAIADPYQQYFAPPGYGQPAMMPPLYQQQQYGLYDHLPPLKNLAQNQMFQAGVVNRPSSPISSQHGSDTMADAWNCQWCSYANFPTRTVCEMCGRVQLPGKPSPGVQDSGQQNLMSRGSADNLRPSTDMADNLVCDSRP